MYVGITEKPAVQVREEWWRQVELSAEDVLGDLAMEVMFDAVLRSVSATEHTAISWKVAFLVSPVRAPSVPQGTEGSSTDSGRCQLL